MSPAIAARKLRRICRSLKPSQITWPRRRRGFSLRVTRAMVVLRSGTGPALAAGLFFSVSRDAALAPMPVSDLDITRTAHQWIQQHGDDALPKARSAAGRRMASAPPTMTRRLEEAQGPLASARAQDRPPSDRSSARSPGDRSWPKAPGNCRLACEASRPDRATL